MADTAPDDDLRWMALALALGRRGLGRVWPNPAVGCVLVADGRVVGRGWTQPGGRPHAEVMALTQSGARARGATAYVSLEPCAHHGKTPPCAEALIRAGVARVVSALQDPDPRVSGGGHAMLLDAGVAVQTDVLADRALRDQTGFLSRITRGRPMVTLKLALSLDGRIATASGESQWITGPQARRMGHALRARHDAVLVGAGTARADDPTLTVRELGAGMPQPLRIVASRALDLPCPSNLTGSIDQAPLWLLHGPDAPQARRAAFADSGARLFELGESAEGVDLAQALQALGEAGLTRVYCEGGGALAARLLQQGLVDELAVFSAGAMIGAEGRPGLGALGLQVLADAPRFALCHHRVLGGDIYSHWRLAPEEGA